jgi:lysophospholipase L1-like esterase
LFESLDALEHGLIPTVTIVQLGDSHTAGDRFSGRLRELFQARFGNAGRGMLAPGVPFDGFRPTQVAVSAVGWVPIGSWPGKRPGPFGLTGFQAQATQPGDVMTIEPRDEGGFDQVSLGFVRQPGGGGLVVRADGAELARIPTDSPTPASDLVEIDPGRNVRRIELAPAGDGPVKLLSWATARKTPGVIWDSHGVSGSTLSILDRWDRETMAQELAQRAPAAIVLAFGTNEGFDDGLTAEGYSADLERQITRLREMAPDAAILLIGPPDGERLPARCPGAMRADVRYGCAPLTAAEERAYAALFQTKRPKANACRWHEPPRLALVRRVQAEIAAKTGSALWDWSSLMGETCGLHRWTQTEPPLARLDHVHLTVDGYARSAEALFDTLMQAYRTWQAPSAPAAQAPTRRE